VTVVPPSLVADISAEAARIRSDGSLPPGFEAQLAEEFTRIASDPRALEQEVARRAAASQEAEGAARSFALRAAGKATRVARRAAGGARRRIAPRLRTVERRGIERAGRSLEAAAVELQVVADLARRVSAGSVAERGLARAGGGAGFGTEAAAVLKPPPSLRVDADGRFGDADLDQFVTARLSGRRGQVLHAECGDGRVVGRLRQGGIDALGVDPRLQEGEARRGALEALARRQKGSLAGILLSGVTDRVTPASARALVRLAATRLGPGGVLVLLSTAPGPRETSDPVMSDLSPGRPLHPATWCHLLARLGLEEISVRESGDGAAFAVAAARAREG
jgi:hypothetical protein